MQTFVPYPCARESARVLDRQRLGKQRVETMQLLKALAEGGGWSNHPAANMWRGHERALIWYGMAVCDEWLSRGYKDTCRAKIMAYADTFPEITGWPTWWGQEDVHASHRSNLLRKAPEHYVKYGWTEDDSLPYVWPVSA